MRDVNFLIKFRGLLVELQLQEGSESVLDFIFSFYDRKGCLDFLKQPIKHNARRL